MRKFKSVKKGYILLFWYLFSCFPVFMGTWSVGVHWQMFSFVCPSVLSGRLLVGRANQWNWQHLSLSLCTQSIHIAPCYLLDWLWPGYFRLHITHYHTPKNKHISNVLCWSDIYWRWIRAGLWCNTSLYHKMVLQMNVILMYFLNNCVFWDFTKIFLFIYFCCRGWHRDIQLNLELYQWTQPHACLWTVWGRCNTWRKQVNSTQWGRSKETVMLALGKELVVLSRCGLHGGDSPTTLRMHRRNSKVSLALYEWLQTEGGI